MKSRACLTAACLVAVGLALAPAAQARDWHGGYRGRDYHRGNNAGAAVAAGIIGFGLGAAIASNRGYGPPPPVYYGSPGYYAAPPPAVYYGY